MKDSNRSVKSILAGKQRARYLIVVKGYSQKETAKIIGFSENTVSHWSIKHGWCPKDQKLNIEGGLYNVMEGFLKSLEEHQSEIANTVKTHWYEYLKNLQRACGGG